MTIDRKNCFWSVYGLVDPRGSRLFYVGLSVDPWRRLREHCTAPTPIGERIREMQGFGFDPSIIVFSEFKTRAEAQFLERLLISSVPNTLNSQGAAHRSKIWSSFSTDNIVELGTFDRNAYQREYMRKRRAALKTKNGA